jgi:hypothetical protein
MDNGGVVAGLLFGGYLIGVAIERWYHARRNRE